MAKKEKPESKTGAVKRAPKTAASRARSTSARTKAAQAATARSASKKVEKAPAKSKAAAKAKPAVKRTPATAVKAAKSATKSKAAVKKTKKAGTKAAVEYRIGDPVMDPIGDTTDGEGRVSEDGADARTAHTEVDAYRAETSIAVTAGTLDVGPEMEAVQTAASEETEAALGFASSSEAREPEKLERLQKILSQAGIASRRRAEEMITEGRVMVNGEVVTTLGSKADPARDHIRVDGKLLHGAERHRYFVLNKPRGYVTTVSDPEGRPTVMQFFEKMRERVYPVGRLDYQSEGLLLMTNDGELANLLTKAGSGVEKTYLVKVAGQPTELELERLRTGVDIEREREGSGRVRTAPARVRQVREGNNPWFEVVLIEGRNRELRKMFAAVGHFVEKIRRVGYGPLVLDVEPGTMRELSAEEVTALRLTAKGKVRPRRVKADRMLPKEAGVPAEQRAERRGERPREKRFDGGRERGGRPGFGGQREGRPFSRQKPGFEKRSFERPRFEKPGFDRPQREPEAGGAGRFSERPKFEGRKPFAGGKRPFGGGQPSAGPRREFGGPRGDQPRFDRPRTDKPGFEKRSFDRPRFDKPRFDRPRFEKPAGEREANRPGGFAERPKFEGRKPFAGGKRPFGGGRPSSGPRREFGGPRGDRPQFDRPRSDRPRFDKPGFGGRPSGSPEGRPADGPRKPFRPREDRPGFKPGAGRAKPGFGERPGGFGRSGGRPSGFKRPNKPGGGGRGGPRSGGGRPGRR